jgi:tetratricopeptide (TPR) repeat protein
VELQREQRIGLEEVEVALSQERFVDVLNLTAGILDDMSSSRDRALAQYYAAQAHIRQAQPEPARPLLEAARSFFEAQGDGHMVVECLDWYAAILHIEEDPQALPTARTALRLAIELRPPPTRSLVRIWGRIGAISVSQHKWRAAVDAYEKAVEVGGDLLDLSRMAKMYNDLSIAYRCMNRIDEARRNAIRSVEVHELLNDRLSVGRAETNLALILLREARPLDAQERLARALGIFRESKQDHGRSIIHLALSEAALSQGHLDEALHQATEAVTLAGALNERASLADAHELLGRIDAARSDWSGCDREFAAAIRIVEDLGIPERLARIHALYADILEKRGKTAKARLHWRWAVEAEHPDLTHDVSESPSPLRSRSTRAGKASQTA